MNTNFYSLWFDPTGNRTPVYRFSSRRSIHSTTDTLLALLFSLWALRNVVLATSKNLPAIFYLRPTAAPHSATETIMGIHSTFIAT